MAARSSKSGKVTSNTEAYERITAKIVAGMERGEAPPWQRPWRAGSGRPRSLSSSKAYSGINWMILAMTAMEEGYSSPWWGTYRQIAELGGQVRGGEKGTQVLLFKDREVSEVVDGKTVTRRIPLARTFTVFSANQADGLPEKYYPQPGQEPEKLADAEELIGVYLADGPKLRYAEGNKAFYHPATDTITLPLRSQFRTAGGFYSVALHEAGHSTGHASRLNREGISEFDHFGSGKYAREELVAQITSAMLRSEAGVEGDDLDQSDVAYLQSWSKVLKDDPSLLVKAASAAQKAADCVLEPTRELQKQNEAEAQTDEPVADYEPELVA